MLLCSVFKNKVKDIIMSDPLFRFRYFSLTSREKHFFVYRKTGRVMKTIHFSSSQSNKRHLLKKLRMFSLIQAVNVCFEKTYKLSVT